MGNIVDENAQTLFIYYGYDNVVFSLQAKESTEFNRGILTNTGVCWVLTQMCSEKHP